MSYSDDFLLAGSTGSAMEGERQASARGTALGMTWVENLDIEDLFDRKPYGTSKKESRFWRRFAYFEVFWVFEPFFHLMDQNPQNHGHVHFHNFPVFWEGRHLPNTRLLGGYLNGFAKFPPGRIEELVRTNNYFS